MAYRIAIMISGRGSNMQALIRYAAQKEVNAEVAIVIADNPAEGLGFAEAEGIKTTCIDRQSYASKALHENAIIDVIQTAHVDAIFLAGYMRVLTAEFCNHFNGQLFNIHPSLLPRHKGLDTHQRAIDAGDTEHGCSVHLVTPELDDGPVLIQRHVPIKENDTADRLAARVLKEEHQIYPMLLGALAHQLLIIKDNQIDMKIGTLPGRIDGLNSPIQWPQ